jgi:P-type E1-E2 ATPase
MVTAHARSGMEALGRLKVDSANLIFGDGIRKTSVKAVEVGQSIRVFPGETIPLDGIIIQGSSSIDKSIITGESIPADVSDGDEVYAGTSNLHGSIDVKVTKNEDDSTVSRMARLMEDADTGKSRIVNAADRWAEWILLGAGIITMATYFFTQDIYRAITIMVVFCPCAFVLATPTGIMAAAGNMSMNGILLRDVTAIEGLSRVGTMVFDKTGTLTTGRIVSLGFTDVSSGMDIESVEGMVSALESRSEHPLGRAIAGSHEPVDRAW